MATAMLLTNAAAALLAVSALAKLRPLAPAFGAIAGRANPRPEKSASHLC